MTALSRRLLVVLALIAVVTVVVFTAQRTSAAAPLPLDAVPLTIDGWRGSDAGPLDRETARILAADAYVNRSYASSARAPVGFYAAYYAQQRPGVSIHSPLHCLPGTGWEPLEVGTRTLAVGDADYHVRRMLIRKERDEAVVLYWYSIHGRVVGDEIRSKFWLLHDSLRFGRSDAALIRLAVPVTGSIEGAERDALDFGRALIPSLSHLWS